MTPSTLRIKRWLSLWRHQMETFSALLAFCAGNSPVIGEFPAQRPVTRSFDVFFDLRLNGRLSKQSWGWWFETPSRPLLHQSNVRPISSSASFLVHIWSSSSILAILRLTSASCSQRDGLDHSQVTINVQIYPGPCINIKTVFPRYGDSHVKDKTVGETVLSLTWESLYW